MNDQDWAKWTSIAEIIGSVAVVVTLIAVLLEMRANSELTRVSAYQSEIRNINVWRDGVSSDPVKVKLFVDYTQGIAPAIDTEEYTVLSMTITNLWVNYESAYTAYKSGIIGPLEWERMERNICSELDNLEINPSSELKERTFFRLTTEFQEYVLRTC